MAIIVGSHGDKMALGWKLIAIGGALSIVGGFAVTGDFGLLLASAGTVIWLTGVGVQIASGRDA